MAKAVKSIGDYLKQVGENVYIARRRKGYTMQELGEDIGMDRSAISKIESGKNLTIETLIKLSTALEVHPSDLLEGDFSVSDRELDTYIAQKRSRRKK